MSDDKELVGRLRGEELVERGFVQRLRNGSYRMNERPVSNASIIEARQLLSEAATRITTLSTENARLREALESIRGVNGANYESDRAWALGLQLRAKCALDGWLVDAPNQGEEA